MNKIVSYHEFLKHKNNLTNYLQDLFDKMPDVTVYFPITLSSEERHLIYTNSKGYLFEKLHKIGSKYSVKLWKPDNMEIIAEEKSDDNDLVTVKDDEDDEDDESGGDYVPCVETDSESDEEYDMQIHLTEISEKLDKHLDLMLNKIDRCSRSVRRLECIFTCIITFNSIGSILVLAQTIGMVHPLPALNMITDF